MFGKEGNVGDFSRRSSRRRSARQWRSLRQAVEPLEDRVLLSSAPTNLFPDRQYPVSGAPVAVVTADLLHNGRMDVVSVDPADGLLTVMINNGDGTFTTANYAAGTNPTCIAAADLNNDGFADLVVGNSQGVGVLLNNGQGAFPAMTSYNLGSQTTDVAIGDFDGNHLPDVVAVDTQVAVLFNTGSGGALANPKFSVLPNGDTANIVAVGDITGDGKDDVVTAAYWGTNVYVLAGSTNGLKTPVTYDSGLSAISSLQVGDLNGDGKADVVAGNNLKASLLFNNGSGTLLDGSQATIISGGNQMALGHVDAGSSLDLVNVSYGGAVTVHLNNGSGTFGPAIRSSGGDTVQAIALADINGDGLDDLVTANGNGTVTVQLNRGSGQFQSTHTTSLGGEPNGIVSADFNSDGALDLATINAGPYHDGNTVSIMLNNGAGAFNQVATYPVGNDPRSIVVGDFNGDGKPDLAVANYLDDTVSVLINQGSGAFAPAVAYSAGKGPIALAVGDMDGDHKPDLVVADYSSATVAVLHNNGSGTFAAPALYQVNGAPDSLVVGDFNGDASLDIATSVYATGNVQVLLNDTHGSFSVGPTLSTSGGAYSLVTGDFDGNGKADLALLKDSTDLELFLNNGAGGFNAPTTITVPAARTLIVGDVNGDTHSDLVAILYGSYSSPGLAVLFGNGSGGFAAPAQYQNGSSPAAVAIGDFNGDGDADLAVANSAYGAGTISILRGRGDGTLGAPLYYVVGQDPRTMATGDFNADGYTDLATANYDDGSISLLISNGSGAFNAPVVYTLGAQPTSIAVGYFDNNSSLDIVTADSNGNVSVLLNNGAGVFTNAVTYTAGQGPVAVVAADFNGDGRADIAIADALEGNVAVLMNHGDGTFGAPIDYSLTATPTGLAAGDINGDGFADLVVTSYTGNTISVLMNDKSGGFGAPVDYAVQNITGPVAVGDLNGDGLADVVASNSPIGTYPSTIAVCLTNADGTLAAPVNYTVAGNSDVVLGDFNNDGRVDIATGGSASYRRTVSMLLGNGDGTFAAAQNTTTPGPVLQLTAGDFDGDHKLDLAISSAAYSGDNSSVTVMLGAGTGQFISPATYSTSVAPRGMVSGDFNGDSRPDLVTVNGPGGRNGSSSVSVMLNSGGVFGSATNFSVPGVPDAVATGDFNGDGKLDLAIAEYGDSNGSQNILILLGHGDGTFAAPTSYAAGTNADALAVGDFSGDGHPDLAVVNNTYPAGSVTILMNNGTGGFSVGGADGVGKDPVAVVAADLDGDGKPDLAVVNEGDDTVTILKNTGGAFTTAATLNAGSAPNSIVAADLDGNGAIDLAVNNSLDKTVSVLLNQGAGSFAVPVNYPLDAPASAIGVGDFNGDGWNDLIASSYANNGVAVLLNAGSGVFSPPQDYATGVSAGTVAVADFDGNQMPDVAVTGGGSNSVAVMQNQTSYAAPTASPTVEMVGRGDDLFTSNARPIFTGVTFPFDTVDLFVDNVLIGSATAGANGTYQIPMLSDMTTGSHAVTAQAINRIGVGPLSSAYTVVVDTAPPTASVPPSQLTMSAAGQTSSSLNFSVAFNDNTSVDPNSIHTGSITLTLPDGSIATPTLLSINGPGSSATSNVANFQFANPNGSFDNTSSYGTYTLNLVAGGFADLAGNLCAPSTIGTMQVSDTTPPTANSSGFSAPKTNATTLRFTVNFSDNVAVDATSIQTGSVYVTQPDGTVVTPDFISSTPGSDGGFSAIFELDAPGGEFNTAADGPYLLSLPVAGCVDTNGNACAAADLGSFTFTADIIPPTASSTDFIAPARDSTELDFTITYTDNQAVDPSTITADTVAVIMPDGTIINPTIVSSAVDGNSVLVAYKLAAPSGVFSTSANGQYVLKLSSGGFSDVAGNPALAATIASFSLNVDTIAPTATLLPVSRPSSDQKSLNISVDFIANAGGSGPDISTLSGGNVHITGPNGVAIQAVLVSTKAIIGGVEAVYQIPAPGGFFSTADNGNYTIDLVAASVADRAGNFIGGQSLGSFDVALSAPPANPDLTGTIAVPTSPVLPASRKNFATLALQNVGTDTMRGRVPVVIYASPTPSLDPSTAIKIDEFNKGGSIRADASKSVRVRFSEPDTIADGQYYLIAVLDPDNTVVEQYKSNNTFASTGTVRFEAPIVDLAAQITSLPDGPIAGRKKGKFKISIVNNGNVKAKGSADLKLFLTQDQSLDPQTAAQLEEQLKHVSINPGKSKNFTFHIRSSGAATGFLAASVSYTGSPADSNPANDLIFSNQRIEFQ